MVSLGVLLCEVTVLLFFLLAQNTVLFACSLYFRIVLMRQTFVVQCFECPVA